MDAEEVVGISTDAATERTVILFDHMENGVNKPMLGLIKFDAADDMKFLYNLTLIEKPYDTLNEPSPAKNQFNYYMNLRGSQITLSVNDVNQ